jgi:mono/diheme cytochrome c family protein
MRRRSRTLALLTAALLSAAALAACGTTDDEGEKTVAEETQSTPAEQEQEQPLSPAEEHGRTLFVETCGSCHTLDAAGTQGQVGPDLNELQVDEAQVLRAIEVGGTGSGTMPAGLYKGKDAQDVATFVANSGPGV